MTSTPMGWENSLDTGTAGSRTAGKLAPVHVGTVTRIRWMWISQDPWGDIPIIRPLGYESLRLVWVPDDDLVWPLLVAWRYGDD